MGSHRGQETASIMSPCVWVHFEDICLCCWLQDGESKQGQKYCKGEKGEGGETNSHSIMHQPLYGTWRCHTAIANKLVLLIWWARIWFPLCLCEPTQLSWQAGGKGSHTRQRAGSVHCSSEARRKEELKTAKSYWNANCSQCTLAAVRSWAPVMQWIKWEAIKMPLN